eukprot:gene9040-18722_t
MLRIALHMLSVRHRVGKLFFLIKLSKNDYDQRLNNLREALEDGKEILRDTLYQDALKSKPSPEFRDTIVNKKSVVDAVDITTRNVLPSKSIHKSINSAPPLPIPGAKEHPILTMSEETFRSTKISDMMRPYGEAGGGGSCADDFGNALVNRWRKMKRPYCNQVPTGISAIDCYLVSQTRHHGNGDNLCVMHNVSLNMGIFADDNVVRPVVQNYVNTRHGEQPYVKFPRGFLQADCATDRERWQGRFMPGWNEDLTVKALSPPLSPPDNNNNNKQSSLSSLSCTEWVDHNVLLIQRDTFANFFHDSEDLINAFLALAILEWKLEDTQLYFTDLYPEGPFWSIWDKAFSAVGGRSIDGSHHNSVHSSVGVDGGVGVGVDGPYSAWSLRQRFDPSKKETKGSQSQSKKKERRVCYRDVAVGIYGPAAPITVASWDTPCRKTALVRAYSDFVIRGMQLQGKTHYSQSIPSKTVVVTFMARRPSSEWPEKKYCNDTASFFLCRLWDGEWGVRKLGRMIHNEAQLVQGLKGLETKVFANGALVKVQDVDYNVLTIDEQIEIDLKTDVMVGPHGAGLMHNIFMRDRAALVEMFVDGSGGNRHFHNLASWYGRSYTGESFDNPVTVQRLVDLVSTVISQMDLNSY